MADLQSRIQQSLSGIYTIERELGGGGMSKVFVADEHQLGRKVVVKVLSPELAAAMSTSRFEREIRVAASLQQANIVPVFAAGEIEGLPYYTMPYVEGESLRARLSRGPLAIGESISILRDVSRALAYAHERGVVHRDIKPDNVLLSGHTAVVTDFGIAKAIAAAAAAPSGVTLTQLGTAIGTPAYMAPEQAAGDPDTDHRADIYAFGCLAYELLTGQQPFTGLAPHKLLVAHMTETPVSVAERRSDCPPALAALVMQCLAKTPDARPAHATELLHRLDAVSSPSNAQAAVPGILIGGSAMLRRALLTYVVAFAVVAIVARAAIVGIGLPDWVFSGALVIMALGLPVILFAAYSQYVSHRAAIATPTITPGGTPTMAPVRGTMAMLAVKASPHMSWRRISRGGIAAVLAFVLLVGGYMAMRSMGIGPAGSLLASGKLAANDKVLVTSFDAPGADTSLGSTIAAAVRTDLAQSRAVRLVTASAIAQALEQMQRSDTARIDFATAREIAQRTGAKAIVAGSVVPAGTGFLVTARLVVAESGDELASYSESAKDVGDLIPSVDRLTKSLRGKIGESLKEVRDAPRLDQVTTASLGALRSYATALHANDVQGNYESAVQHFTEAIKQDSTFAMAHVQLAYSLQSLGGRANVARAETSMTTAFRLRERLPERERYNIEGAFYMSVKPDRRKAIPALKRAVELDSSNIDASNSLGAALHDVQDFKGAEAAYRLALSHDPLNGTMLVNLAMLYTDMGRHVSFDSIMAILDTNKIPYPTAVPRAVERWSRREYDAAEKMVHELAASEQPAVRLNAYDGLASIAGARGRLRETDRWLRELNDTRMRLRGDTASPYGAVIGQALYDAEHRRDSARGVSRLDAVVRDFPLSAVPWARDRSAHLGLAYARLGRPDRARALIGKFESRLSAADRAPYRVLLQRVRGAIAIAESKTDSAISLFRQASLADDGLPNRDCIPCTPLFLGFAFDAAGQADSARKYLVDFVDLPSGDRGFTDRYFLASSLVRLGELYEQQNDAVRATEYYGRFVDLWAKADPELQPRVADVRSRIDRMNRTKR